MISKFKTTGILSKKMKTIATQTTEEDLEGLKKMGNGASHAGSTMTIDGEQMETSRLKMLYPELRSDLKKKDEIISEKNKKISSCELEISNLKKEIRQLQSVLEATGAVSNDIIPEEGAAGEDSSSSPKNKFLQVASKVRNKRFAISAESGKNSHAEIKLDKIPKKPEVREMIKRAILNNNFLKHLEEPQVVEMILCMSLKTYTKNECVVTEGEPGNALFVINKGSVEVQQGDKKLGKPLGPGVLFGELAILYNCTRTATVRTLEDVEVWTMERRLFQLVMKNTGTMRRDADMNFLRCVPVFQDFDADKLYKIVQIAGEDFFYENEYIIREGERGDAFYIIKEGTVKVLQMIEGKDEPQEIRKLKAGDYFGEKALLSEDVRTASIVAEKEGAKCLVIERENIMSFIGDIKDIRDKDYGDKARNAVTVKRKLSLPKSRVRSEYQMKELVDFKTIATLGLGGFGRVELVQDKADTTKTYALKYLGKKHIVETKQQEHVFNEKNILISMDSPFIVQLYKTFRDTRYVYLLMEVCLGGELWTILRDKDHFDEMTTRFYTSCVIEALDYLHQRGIVYRDLKPENLLLDAAGYVKLVDFGFAKKISSGTKTWTFCGTPEYVAPEIILNKGHDCSADYWSLGILIYELMTGNPPFTSSDSMTTYNIILRGIDALDFSSKVTKNAQQLIKRLCRENPQERLGNLKDGIMEIRKNKWFQGFHWAGVQSRALTPPFKPKIRSPTDSSNFDHYKSSKEHAPEEKSGWDKDF